MDGLECSEIRLREIDSALLRMEAEFYQKRFRRAQQMLSKYKPLDRYAKKIECGPFGSNLLDTEYTDNGVLVVRPFNLINCSIEKDRLVYTSPETIRRNGLKCYGRGTVLFSRVGDIKVGYANRDRFTISPNIIVMDCGNEPLAKYIALFFNTAYGNIQILRQLKVAAQPTISTEIISRLRLPTFDRLMPLVVKCFSQAEECLDSADHAYGAAETFLEKQLAVAETSGKDREISVKRLSESYASTGRLDAEYYQPKYESYTAGLDPNDTIASLCDLHDKNFEPIKEERYLYIELSNVGTRGEIAAAETIPGGELPTRARRRVKTGQVIISSIEGSLQSCALVTPKYDGALCSTGFYVLTSDLINSETLLVLFKSKLIQALMKQRCSGTILPGITKEEFLSIPLLKIDKESQEAVARRVQKSFSLRQQSEDLLDRAKHAMELAVEQGEDAAIAWLKDKVQ